ncbi:MAG: xanthine phosphoribosyltransferase, partial [Clostridia bacterium]|nr:xanthine phosphoribosyltransferase [Clostridia bacterium]
LTVEASGIAVAVLTAQYFGCPAVFAKKAKTSNISDDVYSAPVKSYTHNCINQVMIEKKYLNPGDKVLVIDDFLAHGEALTGLFKLIEDAGAEVVGAGIVIEKAFQAGGKDLRKRGFRIESLARISGMDAETGSISFIN